MKLIVKCQNCRQENEAPHKKKDRIEYAKKHGEDFKLTCTSCNQEHQYHVDEIRAIDYSFLEIIKNRIKLLVITAFISFIVGFYFTGILGGTIALIISLGITVLFGKSNNTKQNINFNKYKLKGHISSISLRRR